MIDTIARLTIALFIVCAPMACFLYFIIKVKEPEKPVPVLTDLTGLEESLSELFETNK